MKRCTSIRYWKTISVILFLTACNSYSQIEDYSQWAYSKDITINTTSSGYGISKDIQNFPYLVRLNADNFDFSQAKVNGEDIRFANSGGTHLHYQIDSWDNTVKAAAVWVKVDEILGNNGSQFIKMHWGKSDASDSSNSTAVFETSNNFAAVWHFSPTDTFADATANANNGTNQNSIKAQGAIGEARGFSSGRIEFGNGNSLRDIDDNVMVSAWIKTSAMAASWTTVIRHDHHFSPLQLGDAGNGGLAVFDTDDVYHFYMTDWNDVWTTGRWHYYTTQYSSTNGCTIYKDGIPIFTGTETYGKLYTATTAPFCVGGSENGDEFFDGTIDEVIVSTTIRDPEWVKLCYLNQKPVADAAPTIAYPNTNIVLLFNQQLIEIIPSVTGLIDSITINPPSMPIGLFFDSYTGSLKGNTMDDLFFETYYVTAFNEKGTGTDTITITISPTSIMKDSKKHCPSLIGIKGGDLSRMIYYSVPTTQNIRELTFILYDCKGAVMWSSQLAGSELKSGIQSVTIDRYNKLGTGIYFLEMKFHSYGSEILPAKYLKTIVIK